MGTILFSSFILTFSTYAEGSGEREDLIVKNASAVAEINPDLPKIFIREYRVQGSEILPPIEVEKVLYPYMGAGRTVEDIDQARAALEKAYHDKGFQTVSVLVPEAYQGWRGIIRFQVVEGKVGRLRVRDARFFTLDQIKAKMPSLKEGVVPNFNDVARENIALNTMYPDLQVTPVPKEGAEPGTIDYDLVVKDAFPFHANVELNNRYSAETEPLRLNVAASYNHLWQLGHSVGASYQVSPEDPSQVKVYSGYYIWRFPALPLLNLMFLGTKQDSKVSTLGATAVAGRGETLGIRLNITLPPRENLTHSFSLGADYKHYRDEQTFEGIDLPDEKEITYYPFTIAYNAYWKGKSSLTEISSELAFGVRGSADSAEFEVQRYKADDGFLIFRGGLAHTQELPAKFEAYGKVHGQVSGEPLINREQFGAGGLSSVRGYLEAEVLGDNALMGTFELRTPSLFDIFGWEKSELRLYAFADGGFVTLNETLPEQEDRFELGSVGVGGTMHLYDYLNGSIDAAMPLISQTETSAHSPRMTFRIWADF